MEKLTATTTAHIGRAPKLTPAEYMQVLKQRAEQKDDEIRQRHEQTGQPLKSWARTLPSMMIRPGDEDLVDMEAIEREASPEQPKRTPQPRHFVPAAEIREDLEREERKLLRLYKLGEPLTSDSAAYGGNVHPSIARHTNRVFSDANVDRVLAQQRKVGRLRDRLRAAEKREARNNGR